MCIRDRTSFVNGLRIAASEKKIDVPVLGITGTGGSGKSSLTDELILRLRFEFGDSIRIAILAIDPSRRKSGGALLGDRIRMNAIEGTSVFMRSLATRTSGLELPSQLPEIIEATKRAGYGLVIVETPGIGQGDSGIVPLVDCSLYVMTPEFGAATQLEKIDMLDYADLVAINKFDRRGAEDALRDVRKQMQRNRQAFDQSLDEMPVYGTMASNFNDQGVTTLYDRLCLVLEPLGLPARQQDRGSVVSTGSDQRGIVPVSRQRYLSEIADGVRSYRDTAARQAQVAREHQQLQASIRMLGEQDKNTDELQQLAAEREKALSEDSQLQLRAFPKLIEDYSGPSLVYSVQGQDVSQLLTYTSLSGTKVPRVSLPRYQDHGDILRWLMLENVPGRFPFTAGVFPFKRENEDPTRMFAGEGDAFRTNHRFHYLSKDTVAKRLSTAFDSVTLYGADPAQRLSLIHISEPTRPY